MVKRVVFVDGVSGIGKTTISDITVDFLKYLDQYPDFIKKNNTPHIQNLYEHLIFDEIFKCLDEIVENGPELTLVDRSFFSTLAYDIIFKHGGDSADPKEFQKTVDAKVFGDEKYMEILTNVWRSWDQRIKKLYPTLEIYLLWVLPVEIDAVVEHLKKRGTFENTFTNMANYIQNQNYTFQMLHMHTHVGKILYIHEYITKDAVKDACGI
nr:HZV 115-like/thymidylate kinase-like protein [Oryctes rhinoceros nudivirus]